MISAISNIISNPTLVNIAQNTNASVACKTTVNAIGRPGFILIDKNIDNDTKKFAATKEFLYQATCLLIYMALIVPVFKSGAFKIAKKYIYKGEEGFKNFNNAKEYLEYRKIAEKPLKERNDAISKIGNKLNIEEGLKTNLLQKDKPEMFPHIKGAIELGSLVGSVVGLSILAPQVSQALIHPVLRIIGLEKENKKA